MSLTIFLVGIVTLVLAMFVPPDVYWITNFVGPMFAAVWGPVAFMSVWSKRITADAAYWGIGSGFVFNAVPKALEYFEWVNLPFWLDPILLGGLVSLVAVYFGYYAKPTGEGVGTATTRTVVMSSVLVLIFDFIMTSFLI